MEACSWLQRPKTACTTMHGYAQAGPLTALNQRAAFEHDPQVGGTGYTQIILQAKRWLTDDHLATRSPIL
jgi:hypothetical protein